MTQLSGSTVLGERGGDCNAPAAFDNRADADARKDANRAACRPRKHHGCPAVGSMNRAMSSRRHIRRIWVSTICNTFQSIWAGASENSEGIIPACR